MVITTVTSSIYRYIYIYIAKCLGCTRETQLGCTHEKTIQLCTRMLMIMMVMTVMMMMMMVVVGRSYPFLP